MKILTKAIKQKLPKLFETDGTPTEDSILVVKFFCPWNQWTWYATEYDPEDELFYGYVKGHENEWGYFSLDEIQNVTGPMGLKIERDLHFKPIKFSELKK